MRDIRHIQRCVKYDKYYTASSLAQEVSSISGKSVFTETDCQCLNQCGLHGRIHRMRPLHTIRHISTCLFPKPIWGRRRSIEIKFSFLIRLKSTSLGQTVLKDCGDDQVKIIMIITMNTVKLSSRSVMLWRYVSEAGVKDSYLLRIQGLKAIYCRKQFWKASNNYEDTPCSNMIMTLNTLQRRWIGFYQVKR